MENRIKEIMERNFLTPAKFAKLIQVQPSAVSHILNGRNRPSLEVVQKILKAFPRVDVNWLLTGEGSLQVVAGTPPASSAAAPVSSFAENPEFASTSPHDSIYGRENASKSPEIFRNISEKQIINPVNSPSKNITKIVVFYSDGTFDTFGHEHHSSLKL